MFVKKRKIFSCEKKLIHTFFKYGTFLKETVPCKSVIDHFDHRAMYNVPFSG